MNRNLPVLMERTLVQTSQIVRRHWLKTILLVVFAYLIYQKDLSIDLYLKTVQPSFSVEEVVEKHPEEDAFSARPVNISMFEKAAPAQKITQKKDSNQANEFSNMSFSDDRFATKDSEAARIAKKRKQEAYVKRFAQTAQAEMDKFGIPASIILAQGLLESDAGDSKLAINNHNHFGMKCFSRTCRRGHCSNFTDDSHKDFFRIYKSPWESYRAHSYLLRAPRYKHLYKLKSTDYKAWAQGLKKAGYATDKFYAEKLIHLIEELDLHKYD